MNTNSNGVFAGVSLAIILLSTAIVPFSFDMFFVGQLDIGRYFQLEDVTPVIYLWSWGVCSGQLILAPLFDSIGRKQIFILGVIVNAILSFGALGATSISVIYLIRFLQGFAVAVQIIGSRAIIWDLFKSCSVSTAKAYNFSIMSTLVFAIIALNLSPFIVGKYGWQALFLFLGIYSIVLICTLFFIPETLELRKKFHLVHALHNYGNLLAHKKFAAYTLVGGLIYMFLFATFAGLPLVFSKVYGLSDYQISWILSLNLVCGISGGFLNNWLLHRKINYIFLMIVAQYAISAITAIILLLCLMDWKLSLWVFLPLYLIMQLMITFITANSMTAAIAHAPDATGSASALYGIIQFGMGAVGSMLVPIMFSLMGMSLFSVLSVCMISIFLTLVVDFFAESSEDVKPEMQKKTSTESSMVMTVKNVERIEGENTKNMKRTETKNTKK